MKYFIKTFGCAMNRSDSERIAAVLERIGYERAGGEHEADMLIFNTCQIKQKAEDKLYGLRKNLEKLHDENTRLKIAVTGCMVRNTSTRHNEGKDHILSSAIARISSSWKSRGCGEVKRSRESPFAESLSTARSSALKGLLP